MKRDRAPPDAQAVLFKLSELEVQRVALAKAANEKWLAGRKREAQQLARKVLAIEEERRQILESGRPTRPSRR